MAFCSTTILNDENKTIDFQEQTYFQGQIIPWGSKVKQLVKKIFQFLKSIYFWKSKGNYLLNTVICKFEIEI